jgi:hypothetical protein
MPEREKSSLIETLIRGIMDRALVGLSRYAERIMKRLLRLAGLYVAGVVVILLGVAFLAVGVVKWLTLTIPNWLAWTFVGIILFLFGLVLALAAFLASRS